MKVVYLAGPYRSPLGIRGIVENIRAADNIARRLWKAGLAVISPHKNTALFDGNDIDDQVWLDGDLAMIAKCDAIVMMPEWRRSVGATAEHDFARDHGIRIFYLPDDTSELCAWAVSK